MCRLPHPVPGGSQAAFDLCAHPSLARDVVARLEGSPSKATRPRRQRASARLTLEEA